MIAKLLLTSRINVSTLMLMERTISLAESSLKDEQDRKNDGGEVHRLNTGNQSIVSPTLGKQQTGIC